MGEQQPPMFQTYDASDDGYAGIFEDPHGSYYHYEEVDNAIAQRDQRIAELEAGHEAAATTIGWHEQQWTKLTADLRTVGVTLRPNSQGDDDFPGQIVQAVQGRDETIAELRDANRQREGYWRARVAELEAERRWVPVGERLPPMDGDDSSETCSVDVLLHAEFRMTQPWRRVGYWDRINGWHWDDDSPVHPDVRITHWQAITPPEATNAD